MNEQDVFEIGGAMFWRIRDKIMVVGRNYISLGKCQWPTVYVRVAKGIKSQFDADLDYTRLYTEIQQNTNIRGLGTLSNMVAGGTIVGDVPLTLSHRPMNSRFTNTRVQFSLPNTFETMETQGYFLREYVGLFTRFTSNEIKKFSKTWRPIFGLAHAVGYGVGMNQLNHSGGTDLIDFKKDTMKVVCLLINLFKRSALEHFTVMALEAQP